MRRGDPDPLRRRAAWRVDTALIAGAYELATIVTMVGLVAGTRAAASRVSRPWLNVYGDAAAGAVIAAVGIAVTAAGW